MDLAVKGFGNESNVVVAAAAVATERMRVTSINLNSETLHASSNRLIIHEMLYLPQTLMAKRCAT